MIGRRRVAPPAMTVAHAPGSALWLLAGVLMVADLVRLLAPDDYPNGSGAAPLTVAALSELTTGHVSTNTASRGFASGNQRVRR